MFAISNAFLSQAEVVQQELWEKGPLELLFIPSPRLSRPRSVEFDVSVMEWNREWRGGYCRSGETAEHCFRHVPRLESVESPATFLVPEERGRSELLRGLASLAPLDLLRRHGIRKKPRASMWLWPAAQDATPAWRYEAVVQELVWNLLTTPRSRSLRAFSAADPLRLLASDTRFWMHRLMRIALDRHEEFSPVQHEDEEWKPLHALRDSLYAGMPEEQRSLYDVRRPLYGGDLWTPDDQDECDAVAAELLCGRGAVESLEPIVEAVRSNRCHEDFSDHYSWVKEDFERSFHSKRARLRVTVIETVDDFPAWDAMEPDGYSNVLFRDVLSVFDERDRRIILALRLGKTQAEIGSDLDLAGHAVVSRRVAGIKAKLRKLLGPS